MFQTGLAVLAEFLPKHLSGNGIKWGRRYFLRPLGVESGSGYNVYDAELFHTSQFSWRQQQWCWSGSETIEMLCLAPAPCLLLLVYSGAKNSISSFPEYFRTAQIMHKSINIKVLWILQRLILRKQKSTFHFSNLLPIWKGKHSELNRVSYSNPLSFKCRGAKHLEFGGLRFKSPTLLLMSLEKNSASVSLSVQMGSSTAARATCRIVKIKCHIALKQGSLRWNPVVVIYWW